MRETARITWLQLDNSNRIRRAILERLAMVHNEAFLVWEPQHGCVVSKNIVLVGPLMRNNFDAMPNPKIRERNPQIWHMWQGLNSPFFLGWSSYHHLWILHSTNPTIGLMTIPLPQRNNESFDPIAHMIISDKNLRNYGARAPELDIAGPFYCHCSYSLK